MYISRVFPLTMSRGYLLIHFLSPWKQLLEIGILNRFFGEEKIRPIGTIACYLLLVAAFGWAAYSSLVVTGIL